MQRKLFLTCLAIGLLGPRCGLAQNPAKMSRVGLLMPDTASSPARKPQLDAFLARLRELGWVAGRNLVVETRWGGPDLQRQREAAAELRRLQVALIVAVGTTTIQAAHDGAPGVPIVMVNAGDAVGSGFVATLARPGGDLTGTSAAGEEVLPKQLELLSAAVPVLKRVGVLMNSANPANEFFHEVLTTRAQALGLQLQRVDVTQASEIDEAIDRTRGGMLVVLGDPMFNRHMERIVGRTLQSKVPAIYGSREHVVAGGLMSYNSSYLWHWRSAAGFVDKILKGAKPGDLPIEQPVSFEFAVNLKTAKLLGITIPPALLQRADELIR